LKILYLCHRFPFPPKRGGKIRPFNMIKHLGGEVTVASIARSPGEAREGQGIAPFCAYYEMVEVSNPIQVARMALRVPLPTPSSMGFFYSSTLARRVRDLLGRERFELIFVHCSSVAQYVSGVRGIPKILDSATWVRRSGSSTRTTNLSRCPRVIGSREKLERGERRLAGQFDMCTTITRAEWETLESYGTSGATDWFPNGVDNAYFSLSEAEYDPDTICFVGRMDYYPNQECMFDFCANILPRIQERRAQAKLLIVSADPSPTIKTLGERKGVTVTGSVPDVRPYLQRSALMVAPLSIARGTQNKILEAMASGVPVVTSGIAAGGVDAVAQEHFLVANSRMLSHHEWGRAMQRLDGIIERCLAVGAARTPQSTGSVDGRRSAVARRKGCLSSNSCVEF